MCSIWTYCNNNIIHFVLLDYTRQVLLDNIRWIIPNTTCQVLLDTIQRILFDDTRQVLLDNTRRILFDNIWQNSVWQMNTILHYYDKLQYDKKNNIMTYISVRRSNSASRSLADQHDKQHLQRNNQLLIISITNKNIKNNRILVLRRIKNSKLRK